jgi:hypothetical protein
LHKNGANRIIALKFGELMELFRLFPQAFPLLCAKLNTTEIFFSCVLEEVVPGAAKN